MTNLQNTIYWICGQEEIWMQDIPAHEVYMQVYLIITN